MERNPASFKEWLSGACLCSDPPAWKHNITSARVEIIPASRVIVYLFVFLLVFILVPTFGFCMSYREGGVLGIIGMLMSGVVGALGTACVGYLLTTCVWEYLKGPYLIYSFSNQHIMLPRENLILTPTDVVGWRVVSGNWIGPEVAQTRRDGPISELQLIVASPEVVMAYAIVGGKAGGITASAQAIARATDRPIEIVVQRQGISFPSTRRHVWEGM